MKPTPFVCVPKDGSVGPEWAERLGARGYRLTYDLTRDQPPYLHELQDAGLETYCSLDTDSFQGVDWSAVRADPESGDWQRIVREQLQDYAGLYRVDWSERSLVDYANAINEWEGEGPESSRMPAFAVNAITRMMREVMGPRQIITAGSLVSGQPSSLGVLELQHVQGIDLHLYTGVSPDWDPNDQGEGGERRLDYKLAAYRSELIRLGFGHLFIALSEIGWSSSEGGEQFQARYCADVMGYLLDLERLEVDGEDIPAGLELVAWFALHNHAGFGLVRDDWSQKPAFQAYAIAAAVADEGDDQDDESEDLMAKYPEQALSSYWASIDASIPFDIAPAPRGLGICRHWAEDPYKYGPPVSGEASDGSGNMVQLFAKRPIRWTPQGPEDVDP